MPYVTVLRPHTRLIPAINIRAFAASDAAFFEFSVSPLSEDFTPITHLITATIIHAFHAILIHFITPSFSLIQAFIFYARLPLHCTHYHAFISLRSLHYYLRHIIFMNAAMLYYAAAAPSRLALVVFIFSLR